MGIRVVEPGEGSFGELVEVWQERCPEVSPVVARVFTMPQMWHQVHVRAAHDGARLVGWGFAGEPNFSPGGWWQLHVVTRAEAAGRGVASTLYRVLRDLEPADTTRVIGQVFDTDDHSLAVATHWGFVQAMHAINSRLELVDLPVPHLPDDVTIDDVPLLDVPDPEAVEAMLLASQTNPEAAVAQPMDLATQREEALAFDLPLGHVLRVDGEPAGICQGGVDGEVMQVFYTGIAPAYRGRGLARLLKQHAHRAGARLGATVCDTNNEAGNTGIRHVNASLGYRRVSGSRRLFLDLAR